MAIYKYTLIKYLKSWSTWIIAGITFFLLIFISFIAFNAFKPDAVNAGRKYVILTVALVAGSTSFLSIFTSVFSGFKSATMFKDEVEDGTFLVMLSKPITRSTLILYKWFALLTVLICYTLLISFSFLIGVCIFDNGYKIQQLEYGGIKLATLRSTIFVVAMIMWGILTVVALIFSSVALLLSTRLSVGTTIGIAIALGVIIPMTSLVGIFTKKPPFNMASNPNAATLDSVAKTLNLPNTKFTEDPKTLYSVGISTGDRDGYRHAFAFDLNFQISFLSSYASDRAIPNAARNYVSKTASSSEGSNAPGIANGNFVAAKDQGYFQDVAKSTIGDVRLTQLKTQLNDSLNYTWTKSWALRVALMNWANRGFALLQPQSQVPGGFLPDLSTILAFYDKSSQEYKTLANAQKDPHAQVLWTAAVNFLTTQTKTLAATSQTATPTQIQHQISLLNLSNALYDEVQTYKYNFKALTPPANFKVLSANLQATSKNQAKNLNQGLKVQADNGLNIDQLLVPAGQLTWLSNPLSALSTNAINDAFTNSKLQMNNAAKYLPAPAPTNPTAVQTQTDAINWILNNNKNSKTTYQQLAILFDNGYVLKRIAYKDYASRAGILAAYLTIAFVLVPLAYLMIRRQDYR